MVHYQSTNRETVTQILQWGATVGRAVRVLTSLRCLLSLLWTLRKAPDTAHQSGDTFSWKAGLWGTGKRGRIWVKLILLESCLPEIENRWDFRRVVCWFCWVFFLLFVTSSLERSLLKYHCGQHHLLSKHSWAGICFRCFLPSILAELADEKPSCTPGW